MRTVYCCLTHIIYKEINMPTIENFATVSYTSGGVAATRTSNLAEIELTSSLSFTKTTLGDTYTPNTPITNILSVTNTASTPVTNITITDDLGTYTPAGIAEVTPLDYVAPARLLINGQDTTAQLTVTTNADGSVTFSFPTLPAGATANIVYNTLPNDVAPRGTAASINTTATLTSDSECSNATATASIGTADVADISVVKTMSPNPVICGEAVTYTIRIYNYGNIPAENVRLTDTFTPAPEGITVSRNGVVLSDAEYTYADGTLTVPSAASTADTIPAATFTRDTTTGVVNVVPGVVEYVIVGTI